MNCGFGLIIQTSHICKPQAVPSYHIESIHWIVTECLFLHVDKQLSCFGYWLEVMNSIHSPPHYYILIIICNSHLWLIILQSIHPSYFCSLPTILMHVQPIKEEIWRYLMCARIRLPSHEVPSASCLKFARQGGSLHYGGRDVASTVVFLLLLNPPGWDAARSTVGGTGRCSSS